MWMILLSALLLDSPANQPLPSLKTFALPEDEEVYLGGPYDCDFDDSGKLYAVDIVNHRVLYWNADGTYAGAFGRKGEGPGELQSPYRIKATKDEVYVLSSNGRFSVFDTAGTYKRSFSSQLRIRNFGVLNPDLLLIFQDVMASPTDVKVKFSLMNNKGEIVKDLVTLPHSLFLGPIEGDNNGHIKAYAADGDIQSAGDGTWYFGYGAEAILHHIDAKGNLLPDLKFQLTRSKLTDEDTAIVNSMTFPGPGGQRIGLKDLPGLKVHYDLDKAFYTQFTVFGDKVVFALSPIGGTNGVGIGFSNCSYVICDMKTGKPVKRGRYVYPEDDVVLFNDGRAVGILANEDDAFQPFELNLR